MKSYYKKAAVSQMFMYLTAAIIISFTLLFAGKAIISLLGTVSEVESQQFRTEFERAIDEVSSKYGSVQFKTLRGLRDFEYICVADVRSTDWKGKVLPPELAEFSLIRGHLEDETANIFLITDNVEEKFLNANIQIEGEYDCAEIGSSGDIDIKLEGFGKYARLTLLS
jgi:hypothetical protein